MRTPHRVRTVTRPPRGGFVFAVRFIDVRGEVATHLYRQRYAAERMADWVTDAGGSPVIFAVTIDQADWRVIA
jgi:hypothetical protein